MLILTCVRASTVQVVKVEVALKGDLKVTYVRRLQSQRARMRARTIQYFYYYILSPYAVPWGEVRSPLCVP